MSFDPRLVGPERFYSRENLTTTPAFNWIFEVTPGAFEASHFVSKERLIFACSSPVPMCDACSLRFLRGFCWRLRRRRHQGDPCHAPAKATIYPRQNMVRGKQR
jgi:hypothetical protein